MLGTIVMCCPTTGAETSMGILAGIESFSTVLRCRSCGEIHSWADLNAWLLQTTSVSRSCLRHD